MRLLKLALVAFMTVGLLSMGLTTSAQDKDKKDKDKSEAPKYKIKEVMKEAMKSDLVKDVAEGKGTKADAEKLVEYFTALHANTPPKGSEKAWKERTTALIDAAKGFVAGKGDGAALKKAANCGSCHEAFKGK
jgi:cytochrome c553